MFIGTPAVEAAISGGASGIGLDITQLSPMFLHFLAWQRLNQVCCVIVLSKNTTTARKVYFTLT